MVGELNSVRARIPNVTSECLQRATEILTLSRMQQYALSLKQPWAALLVHGLKTIEVRKWPTGRRGRILIHAARVPDDRPEVWQLVPPEARETAELRGGMIGVGELVGCLTYRTLEEFVRDRALHLNDPAWFVKPPLYGFKFTDLSVLPFRPYSGWMRFFPVELEGDGRNTD